MSLAAISAKAQQNDTTLVNVAYRTMQKQDVLGGISSIDMEELTNKNYNTYSLDNLQGYVGGWNGASLWGNDSYLVLVDGVPREASNVMPTEISQITFLKSAQVVVLYGSRAAKGAILITTKRGKTEGLHVKARANVGINVAKSYPEYLGSAEYMTYYNEACANDGLSPAFSATEIYNTARGTNPYRYPNVDLYSSDYIRKWYHREDATVEIDGGGRKTHFYTNIGYQRQNDVFKFGEANDGGNDRFNVRGNVDMEITDWLHASVDANATFYNSRGAIGDYWSAAATARPNRISPLIPLSYIEPSATDALALVATSGNIIDGQFLNGTSIDMSNIIADYYAAGSTKYTSRQFQFSTIIDANLDKVLRGLSFQAHLAIDYATAYNTAFNNTYAVFTPTWSNYNGKDVIVALTQENSDSAPGTQNISGSTANHTYFFSGRLMYNPTLGANHHLQTMLVGSAWQQSVSGTYHKTSNANLAFEADYDFSNRYYAQMALSLVHSAKLASGHRNALSPSLTLGWRPIANRKGAVVNDLMVSLSGSILNQDIDIDDYTLYKSNWSTAQWWSFHDGTGGNVYTQQGGENLDLGFIKRKELSLHVEASLLNRLLQVEFSTFVSRMDGHIISAENFYPSFLKISYPSSSFVPYINYENDRRIGIDFAIKTQKRFGEVDFQAGLNGTWYTTKAMRRYEMNDYDYQNKEGRPLDGLWGLECLGFFEDEDDVANSPEQMFGGTVRPGDLKYKDQNGDNVIDDKDVVYLGKAGWQGSPMTLGLNISATWRHFTLFALATAGFGAKAMKDNSYWWISGSDKYSAVVRNRWTAETASTATYPRLTTESSANNLRNSTFWMYSTDRIDLQKVQLSYDFSHLLKSDGFVKGCSVYVSGNSLLTISKHRDLLEMSVASAPLYRFYNLGVTVDF